MSCETHRAQNGEMWIRGIDDGDVRNAVGGTTTSVVDSSWYIQFMKLLQGLRLEHAKRVFEFERSNRAFFSLTITDRGDDFFTQFADVFQLQLNEQSRGISQYHVVLDLNDAVIGRFNLYEIHNGTAVLGYRVAEEAAGRGLATAAVRELCEMVADAYRVRLLRAATSFENLASTRVLKKNGFNEVAPTLVGGRPGSWFERRIGG